MPSSTPSSSRIRLLVVRHGETDFNVRGVIQGQLNTEGCQLNAKGKAQAKVVAAALASEKIDEVYASPLGRAKEVSVATSVSDRSWIGAMYQALLVCLAAPRRELEASTLQPARTPALAALKADLFSLLHRLQKP